jgi:exopolysaccharide biosynthesis polyprenyl glycosylphosphotransferase
MRRETHIQVFNQLIDAAFAGLLLLALLIITNLEPGLRGLNGFLTARVTLSNAVLGTAFILTYHCAFEFTGVYNATWITFRTEARKIAAAVSLASVFVLVFPLTSKTGAFGWMLVPCFWAVCATGAVGLAAFRRVVRECFMCQRREVLIVGSGPRALQLSQELQHSHKQEFRVMGFVDSPNSHYVPEEIQKNLIGTLETLDRLLMNRVVDHVMIALPIKSCYDQIQLTIAVCEQAGVRSEYMPQVFEVSLARPRYGVAHDQPTIRLEVVQDDYRLDLKRVLDVIGAVFGLLLLAPAMAAIAAAIKLTSPGPVLFVQQRIGLNKRRFPMFKFRTMVFNAEALQPALESRNEAEGPVFKIRHDPRITRIGSFLRKTSLDELPQLLNVLRSEMSLVGPRPLPIRDVARFDAPHLMRRFSVRPGLTGLWQISGRSNTTFRDWIQKDLHYIDNWSLTLDLIILAKTVPAILKGSGAV